MASLCNFILCAPTAAPTGSRASGSAILRDACLIRWTPPPSSRAKYNLYTTKASAPKQYVYPDPDPIFAASETRKFKAELLSTLSKEMETFGNDLQRVVNVCAEVFSDFLHNEYGGPGTLLVEPFTEIMLALKEENLPGAVSAARASLLWAQTNVDQDWKDRNSKLH
ncbi:protein PLASTID REDOX INSENSITIVE 2, chloroplastic-like [Primulina eburnea]|uniref:protein PLASTID REDOX INSENSITIVE 2, chloroplastic-like n=1 Tax=Primulina eburnea TaxID=1245227 RepID=UPI003C6C34D8